jgi:hypothetical protein
MPLAVIGEAFHIRSSNQPRFFKVSARLIALSLDRQGLALRGKNSRN